MLEVGSAVSFRKLAILLVGHTELAEAVEKICSASGLVPPVMSYWAFPSGGVVERLTCVFRPEGGDGRCLSLTRMRQTGEPEQQGTED